eukprot:1001485-Pelagomonas_calceolata.AAC.1
MHYQPLQKLLMPIILLTESQGAQCSPLSAFAHAQETSNTPSLGQRFAAAGAATLMGASVLAGGAPALASEFDLLAEPKPTTSYYIDDAGALSKSTKSDLDKKLKDLEVRGRRCACIRGNLCGA